MIPGIVRQGCNKIDFGSPGNASLQHQYCEKDFRSLQFVANKNSQSTTALNHCVDCNCLKQSRRLTKSELAGGGSQILFVA